MSAQFEADVRAELLRQSLRDESFIGDVRSDLTVKGQQIAATSDTLAALDRDVRDDLVVKGNQIAAIAEAVARITVGGIDIDVLARAVNDDAARRLAS